MLNVSKNELREAKLFTRYTLLVTRYFLLLTRYFLFVTPYILLVTRCFLLVTPCYLLVTRCYILGTHYVLFVQCCIIFTIKYTSVPEKCILQKMHTACPKAYFFWSVDIVCHDLDLIVFRYPDNK